MARKYTSKCHFTCWFPHRSLGTKPTSRASVPNALRTQRLRVCFPATVVSDHSSAKTSESTKSGVEARCEFLFPAPPAAARASQRQGGRAAGHAGGRVRTLFLGLSGGCRTPPGDRNGELWLPVKCWGFGEMDAFFFLRVL